MAGFSALEGKYSTTYRTDALIIQISSGTNGCPVNDFLCIMIGLFTIPVMLCTGLMFGMSHRKWRKIKQPLSSAWLWLSFFPFAVQHPNHKPSTLRMLWHFHRTNVAF